MDDVKGYNGILITLVVLAVGLVVVVMLMGIKLIAIRPVITRCESALNIGKQGYIMEACNVGENYLEDKETKTIIREWNK